jgi:ubiquitin-activating enzyme E1
VDNRDTRTYIDSRCVTFKKNYIDTGSESFLGHVQTVIPHVTESYNSSRDELDISYPLCAISSFPTIMEHCILWAQEFLNEIFHKHILLFKSYLNTGKVVTEDEEKILLNIFNSLPNTNNDCYFFANNVYNKYYIDNINELLNKFPSDYVLDDKTMFWASPKKCPHNIGQNDFSKEFIDMIALLWKKTFNVPNNYDFIKMEKLPEDLSMYKNLIINEQMIDSKLVYYASSLRALNYDIELIDEFSSVKIIEKVIPRLVSTNSLLAGLACLEFYKVIQNFDTVENYRNSFVNMQYGLMNYAEPISCENNNLWDSFVMDGKDMTVKELLELFETKHNINVTAIMYENFMFYNLIFNNDKTKSRMDMKIVDVVEGELGIKLGSTMTLQICDDGDDDLPEVLFIL